MRFDAFDIGKYERVFRKHPELQEYITHLEKRVVIDELTGLYNYRHFQGALDLEFGRAKRFSHPLSIVLGDIDHFKRYNDTHGHDEGDRLLRNIGRAIKTHVRSVDIPCRYGGDEVALILPETDLSGAMRVANVLRRHIKKVESAEAVTMSFGIGTYPDHDIMNPIGLFKSADSALYLAKRSGRNRVRTYKNVEKLL